MIEKDISNLTFKEELIEKYKNMEKFIIQTTVSDDTPDDIIKNCKNIEKSTYPNEYVIDIELDIKIRSEECTIYRNDENRILMIIITKFKIIS